MGGHVKLVVLYTQPEDVSAFERHYRDVHMPLVSAMPGLERAETGRFVSAPDAGEQVYYRAAEMYFPDQQALDAALASEQGRATGRDYRRIAPPGSRMFVEVVDD